MKINKKKPVSDYLWRIISLFPGSGKTTGKGTSSRSEAPLLEELEPRLLFSADSIAGLLDHQDAAFQPYDSALAESQLFQTEDTFQSSVPQSVSYEVVFVDAGVDDYQQLLADLQNQQDSNRRFEVYLLDSDRDGVEQISELLAGQQEVDAIHIVSHGDSGRVNLGNSWLEINNLDHYSDAIAGWSQVLGVEADLLIYGCDLAGSDEGKALANALGELTGADVAASDDLTGSAILGGDWDLEYQTGQIETGIVFSSATQQNWNGVLATFVVNDVADTVDINPGDGLALDSFGNTTLRAAIMEANALGGADQINLGMGTYTLSLGSSGENLAAEGDLDITSVITITGADAATTIINGGGIDRVFHVPGISDVFTLSDVTVTAGLVSGGGDTGHGGGILVQDSGGQLILDRVIIENNMADGGAGIFNKGTMTLTDVVISSNGDTAVTSEGGGIHNKGQATLNRVTIYGNEADDGGGIHNDNTASHLSLTNVTLSSNTAAGFGGGLSNQAPATIVNSTFTLNDANNGGGIDNSDTIDMTNTIISGNTANSANDDVIGAINSQGYNLIGNTSGVSGLVASDITGISAQLDSLKDNGGFGQTHALLAGSSAANAGSTSTTAVDQTGRARDGIADIGAFESTVTDGKKLYWADDLTDTIVRANADGSGVQTIVTLTSGADPHGVAVDIDGGKIYWSEHGSRAIKSANLDGSGIQTLVDAGHATPLMGPNDIELDLVNGHIYIADHDQFAGNDTIRRVNLDGSGLATFYATPGGQPAGIAVDPAGGWLYWSDLSLRQIHRIQLTGAGHSVILDGTVLNGPIGLEVNTAQGKIYWVDNQFGGTDRIMRANPDGSFIEVLTTSTSSLPTGIALDEAGNRLYWSELLGNSIWHADINGNAPAQHITGLGTPYDLEFATVPATASNIAPVTNTVSASGNEDATSIVITLTGSDIDGTVDNFQLSSLPANGILYTDVGLTIAAATGTDYATTAEALTLYFVPTGNWNGTTSFQFAAKDAAGLLDATPATASITVNAVNDIPVASASSVSTPEGAAYTFVLSDFGYTDVETDGLVSVTITNLSLAGGTFEHSGGTMVTNGMTLTAAEVATMVYTPLLNANGTPLASFDFMVNDADAGVASAQMSINVTAVNDAPVTDAVSITDNEDAASIAITLTGSDIDGTVDFFQLNGLPANGILYTDASLTTLATALTDYAATAESLTLYFAPNADWNGTTSFQFVAKDDGGLLDATPATATFTVNSVNDAPAGANATVTGLESTDYVFNETDFGFTDVLDGDNFLKVEISTLPNSGAGKLQLNGVDVIAGQLVSVADIITAKLVFSPIAGINGSGAASFTFRVQDSGGTANGGIDMDQVANTITFDITAFNDPPTTSGIADVVVNEDAASTAIDLFTAFSDQEDIDASLVYKITGNTNPALFSATAIDAFAGLLTLDYAPNQSGVADITVQVTDTGGKFVETTFRVTVNPVNDIPATTGITDVIVNEDASDTLIDLFAAFADVEDTDAALTYALVNNTNPGLLSGINIDAVTGTLQLGYAANQNGSADLTVRATDTTGAIVDTVFNVTVNPVNDAPTAATLSNDTLQGNTDSTGGAEVGTLSVTDVDLGDTASYTIIGGADAAKFSITGPDNNLLTINDSVLSEGRQSSYEVVVRVTDSGGLTHDETLTIVVIGLDETVFSSGSGETQEAVQPVENVEATGAAETVTVPDTGNVDPVEELILETPETVLGGGNTTPPAEIASETIAQVAQEQSQEKLNQPEVAKEAVTKLEKFTNSLLDKMEGPKLNIHYDAVRLAMKSFNASAGASEFLEQLDELREDAKDTALLQQKIVGSSMVLTSGLSVGYIVWLVRGGVLLSSVLSSLPAWRFIDPLPILATLNGRGGKADEDDESLESLISDGGKKVKAKQAAESEPDSSEIIASEKESV